MKHLKLTLFVLLLSTTLMAQSSLKNLLNDKTGEMQKIVETTLDKTLDKLETRVDSTLNRLENKLNENVAKIEKQTEQVKNEMLVSIGKLTFKMTFMDIIISLMSTFATAFLTAFMVARRIATDYMHKEMKRITDEGHKKVDELSNVLDIKDLINSKIGKIENDNKLIIEMLKNKMQ